MKLLGKRILVEPIPAPAMEGGLHLVERHHPPGTAHVVAVGSKVDWPELKEGQLVAIKPMGGWPLEHGGKKYQLMPPEAVLGMLVPA